ncbi:MAG TPA: phosphate regulon sensor histidine kinase PhoR [Rhodanobacter sp.]|jgi:two-component system phosphate regulon sensor histidine kinase PhoR|nr:phosphate regulon sensor histidine kinase PhoR [Rhodanobacter sp.]
MRRATAGFRKGPVVVLFLTLLLAAVAAAGWGPGWWAFGVALAGQIIALLWLISGATPKDRGSNDGTPSTGRSERRRRLASQLRHVRDAASALPDAIVLLDDQDKARWFNAAAVRLLGLHQHQIGPPLSEQLAGSELGAWLQTDMQQPAIDLPAPADPSLRLSATIMPFGSQLRLLLARDISALSRLEQVRRDFVANVSHELRTPLTVIHGYLELLDPADVPELAPVLGEMRMQSQRMRQIVDDLLTLSRLETREALPDEEVDMVSLLETLRREGEALSQGRHGIAVAMASAVRLHGSIHHLHSAFSNLVSNAVRYTPSGGEIVIGWRRNSDGTATFSVRDNGLGISAEHLVRLAERFYRVSSSRSRESGGTGLGLSIVKHVLNLHQSRLVIESEPGHGSTFSCVMEASRVLPPDSDGISRAGTPAT